MSIDQVSRPRQMRGITEPTSSIMYVRSARSLLLLDREWTRMAQTILWRLTGNMFVFAYLGEETYLAVQFPLTNLLEILPSRCKLIYDHLL